jgi:hypothetical protein
MRTLWYKPRLPMLHLILPACSSVPTGRLNRGQTALLRLLKREAEM